MEKETQDLKTVREFAIEAGVADVTVYRWIKDGFIKSMKKRKGRKSTFLINASELKKLSDK